jgi:hypothetical protein
MATDVRLSWPVALANLVLPGAGLVLLGHVAAGLLYGSMFVACANFALVAVLLVPDDISGTWQALGIGLAGGAYVGTQVRLAQTVRGAQQAAAQRRRAEWLRNAQLALAQGAVAEARAALTPLIEEAEDDLLVALRWAQLVTAEGDSSAARDAWRRVRRLDPHGVYRAQVQAFEQGLPVPPTVRAGDSGTV